jgi:localization factor PodJL
VERCGVVRHSFGAARAASCRLQSKVESPGRGSNPLGTSMTKAFPWGFKALGQETRAAARAAARRSGKSLDDWLDEVILENAQFDLLVGDVEDEGRQEPRRRSSGLRDAGRRARGRAFRRRETPDFGERRDAFDGGAFLDEDAEDLGRSVDEAIARLERRAAESERRTAEALAGLAEIVAESRRRSRSRRDDDLDGAIERPAESPAPRRPADEDRVGEFETAVRRLDRRLTEIAERFEREAEESPAGAGREAPAGRSAAPARPLAEMIAELAQRRSAPQEQGEADAPGWSALRSSRDASTGVLDDIRNSITTLSERLDSVGGQGREHGDRLSLAAVEIRDLRHELAGVSSALADLAPRASVAAVEAALRDLSERLDEQRLCGVRGDVLAPAERLAADLRAVIGELDLSRTIRNLQDEVTAIGDRLAARLDRGAGRAELAGLAAQTREIHDLLKAAAAHSLPLERLEAGLAALTARIDEISAGGRGLGAKEVARLVEQIRATLATDAGNAFQAFERRLERIASKIDAMLAKSGAARFDELNERIERVHKSLADRLEKGAAVEAGQIEQLVAGLAEKIDSALHSRTDHSSLRELGRKIEALGERLAPHNETGSAGGEPLRELSSRIDFVHSELAARIDQRMNARADGAYGQLTELVGQLAKKVDAALDPHADRAAFSSLEQQIAALSERLDRSDENVASFASIERALSGLFDRIEETKDLAARSAEIAAREAAQDVLRETASSGALLSALEKELVELRSLQNESGDRTHETLAAVHETLERVVDRLAGFEEEIADLRKAPAVDEAPASPGTRNSGRQETGAGRLDQGLGSSVQADFIAAARRAAQKAALEAQAAAALGGAKLSATHEPAEPARGRKEEHKEEQKGGAAGSAWQNRKRPLLLGLGTLALLIGAYQVARVTIDSPAPIASAHNEQEGASSGEAAAPRASTRTANAQAPKPPSAIPNDPRASGPNIDRTPVGTIGPVQSGASGRSDVVATIRELATAGDPAAQFELAVRYAEGKGLARDLKAAFHWFEKSAGQGLAPAQYRLGLLYEKGVGVDCDYAQARKWYQRAAQAGNARAMHNLAVLLADGGEGKPDYVTAAAWFRKAAEYGVRDSQFNLAVLYARGLGVTKSLTQSYLWFSAAAAQGDEDAAKKRDDVASRLDSKELAEAKALAAAFRPKQPDRASNEVSAPPGGWGGAKPSAAPETKPAGKPKVSAL